MFEQAGSLTRKPGLRPFATLWIGRSRILQSLIYMPRRQDCLAERVGFEPTVGYKPTPVFKTGAFNRSATSPGRS
jgi:hypothetical protein